MFAPVVQVITPDGLLSHWQGHRRLTRRLIEAYPEDQLYSFSVGGMRPFGELVQELLGMAEPMVSGVVTGEWKQMGSRDPQPRAELLRRWDEATEQLDQLWPQIRPEAFQETIKAFGQYEGVTIDLLLYVIDNEVHHRGQAYVYMRALGVEPPPFWERQ
jgi:uncharacterized damage-inducible protein DinB